MNFRKSEQSPSSKKNGRARRPLKRTDKLSPRSAHRKRSCGRVVERAVSERHLVALHRYAAGLPINLDQACIIIGMSRSALCRLGHDGPRWYRPTGPNNQRGGSRLYEPRDVQAWIEERKRRARGDEPNADPTTGGEARQ